MPTLTAGSASSYNKVQRKDYKERCHGILTKTYANRCTSIMKRKGSGSYNIT